MLTKQVYKWHSCYQPSNKKVLCVRKTSLLPLSDLSETLFETGLSQPARFSSKGNKGIQKLKRVVGLTFTETAVG